jgi:hypothetical protein
MIWIQLVISLVSALAALAAAWYARQAVEAARQTVALTTRQRQAEELERQRRRLERIGELVEAIFGEASELVSVEGVPRWQGWMGPRNELRQALVGLKDELPRCDELSYARNESEAYKFASGARVEVQMLLSNRSARQRADNP